MTLRIPLALALFAALSAASLSRCAAQSVDEVFPEPKHSTRIKSVYLNLTGDEKLSHRLWTYLDFELEDAGIAITNTGENADASVDGELHLSATQTSLQLGVVRMNVTAAGKKDTLNLCGSLSTSMKESEELFNQTAGSSVEQLRKQYPAAQSLQLDPGNASGAFLALLQSSLKSSGFKVVAAPPADLTLRIDLARVKVPVDEKTVKYTIEGEGRNGAMFSINSSYVLSAALTGSAPTECPGRFDDLSWLVQDDGLFRTARTIVKDLHSTDAHTSVR